MTASDETASDETAPEVAAPETTRRGRRARRDGPGRRHRVAVAALVLATLAAGSAIDRFAPVNGSGAAERQEALQREFVVSGPVGREVTGEPFAITVHGVRGAGTYTGEGLSGAPSRTTTGVWIMVDLTITAREEPTILGYAAVVDGHGRTFTASSRVPQRVASGREFQPGVPVRGDVVFEVPVTAAAGGLTLHTRRTTSLIQGSYYMAEVHVVLPKIPEAQLAAWRQQTVELPSSSG